MSRAVSIIVVTVIAGLVCLLTASPLQKSSDVHVQGKAPPAITATPNLSKPNHKKSHLYHKKSHKRHIRKKKQFIIPGLGGYGYGTLGMAGTGLAYGTGAENAYGYAGSEALGQGLVPSQTVGLSQGLVPSQTVGLSQGLVPSQTMGFSQGLVPSQSLWSSQAQPPSQNSLNSRQSLLSSYTAGTGLADYAGGLGTNAASYASDSSLQSPMTSSLSSNGLASYTGTPMSSSLSNGLGSYTGAGDSGSYGNSLSSLVSSYRNGGASDMAGGELIPGKISAASLSAGLDSPNGISNIANLLSSENTAFDSDSPTQVLTSNDLNGLGQRLNSATGQFLGNQGSQTAGSQSFASQVLEDRPQSTAGSQSLGLSSLGHQSSLEAEAQAFNNQLNRLSSGKLNLEGSDHTRLPAFGQQSSLSAEAQVFNSQLNHLSPGKLKLNLEGTDHASFGGYSDGSDTNNINELGQLANTGISDSTLQKLLGQMLAGQGGQGLHGIGSQGEGMGNEGYENSEQSLEDSQPSQAPDEQPGYMSHPMFGGVGHTIHAHASDKPRPLVAKPAASSASETALKVQLQANKEHQKKLKDLKEKLRKLREKLHKLKDDYDAEDYEEQQADASEKSEMQTLRDLKTATEQAIRELQHEAVKAAKRKGVKKLIFIHKFPESESDSGTETTVAKKGSSLSDLGSDLLALIESDDTKTGTRKGNVKKHKPDDTSSLTKLEKQAEQEVNFLTKKNPKVVTKHQKGELHFTESKQANILNPGLHIHIPEPVMDDGEAHSRIHTLKDAKSSAGHTSFRSKPRPSVRDGNDDFNLDGIADLLTKPTKTLPYPPTTTKATDSDRAIAKHPPEKRVKSRHSQGYFSIGCWRDQPERALANMETIFPILDGNDYKHRRFAIKKCAQVAHVQGFAAFALENGGQCLGGKNILQMYNMYGASRACHQDGKGGPWSMEVYKFTVSSRLQGRRGNIPRFGGRFMPSAREVFYHSSKEA